ncbi:hypothetical protein AB9K26_06410 [Psychroserpens sp. XS_ASV72]|uniref:hypothetical protein n=1 Tax=Psychroserpens sp. XS_ASV72 TaxID=3241293 RepID=UPI003511E7F7
MQLYKSRDFGAYFQDTFQFIRRNGKHLFKNYLIVNGIFILILMVIGYFFSKFYTDVVFGGIITNNTNAFDEYINNNAGWFVFLALAFVLIALISAIISYSYIPIYLQLYTKHDGKNFNATDIINSYKTHIGKILIFLVCGILLVIPVGLVAGIASFVLAITIVGLFLIPLVIGAVSLLYQGALIEYIENRKGIWESFGYSWTLMGSKFWAAVGCVGLFYLMSYIAQNVVALIPYFAFIVDLITETQSGVNPDPQAINKSASIMMIAIFVLTYLVGTFLNVIVQVNQGVVFYSLKEDNENINTKSDIDLIGSGE